MELRDVAVTTVCAKCLDLPADRGVLCGSCADDLGRCDGLLPEHFATTVDTEAANGWLVDSWGQAHPLAGSGTMVGRLLELAFAILHESVSREHAELALADGAWRVRDLGSKNGTLVSDAPVRGRARLEHGARLVLGKVPLLFFSALELPATVKQAVVTASAVDALAVRLGFRHTESGAELRILARGQGPDAATSGVALYRASEAASWREITLAPVELALLEVLGARRRESTSSPTLSAACVSTRELAACVPFRSRYANEENVRQAIKRLRLALVEVGVDGLIETLPRHGYYLTWAPI